MSKVNCRLMSFSSFWVLLFLVITPFALEAHGLDMELIDHAMAIRVQYEDGQVLAGATVTIYRPGAADPFTTGISDESGQFAFVPDIAGEWRVVYVDKHGHGVDRHFHVDEDLAFEEHDHQADHQHSADWMKAVTALSLIFGLTALIYANSIRRSVKS